jgi:hypothetical protein
MDEWSNFLVAQAGASAAMLGLLFVSISLNLARILTFPTLPSRALLAMLLLLTVLVVDLLLLIPRQSTLANGIEVLAIGGAIWGFGTTLEIRDLFRAADEFRVNQCVDLVILELATVPFVIAGVLLLEGRGVALYWLAAATILSMVKPAVDAWVLLVEINR